MTSAKLIFASHSLLRRISSLSRVMTLSQPSVRRSSCSSTVFMMCRNKNPAPKVYHVPRGFRNRVPCTRFGVKRLLVFLFLSLLERVFEIDDRLARLERGLV